jgi:hypothetical protein
MNIKDIQTGINEEITSLHSGNKNPIRHPLISMAYPVIKYECTAPMSIL